MAYDFNNDDLITGSTAEADIQKRKLLADLASDSYGRVFKEDSFILPTDVDFFQEGFDIDLQDELRPSIKTSFFLEAPFSTKVGYYEEKKCFVLRAVPLIKEKLGTGASGYLKSEAYFSEELNRVDGDTIHFISESLEDGVTPFRVGDRVYSSFSDMAKTDNALKFSIRVLGVNAPEITHYAYMPYPENEPPEIITLRESKVRPDKAYIYQNRLEETSDRNINFIKMDDHYYEVVDMEYEPGKNEGLTEVINESNKKVDIDGNKVTLKYVKFIYESNCTKETEQAGLNAAKDAISLLSKAQDLRIVVDHKTINRDTGRFESPYDMDYNSINFSTFEKVWNYISKPWKQFFKDDARYAKLGYNLPGMDAYKRYLGAIYVKINVDDLAPIAAISASELGLPDVGVGEQNKITGKYEMMENETYDQNKNTVWVNLAKLLIFKYEKYVEALPDYSGDPTKEYFSGYVSSAFKLWTYDLKNHINLDQFISYTDEFVVERNQFFKNVFGLNYENLLANHGIIGDTILSIPPTNIKCITETQHQKAPLLRSRGPAIKSSTQSSKTIELTLYFNEEQGINGTPIQTTLPNGQQITYWMNGLRSLLAQFHLTPFLPIENEYINKILNIEAVTLDSLQVSTIEGFPRTLQARLVLKEFNYRVYMPEVPIPDYEDEDTWKINAFARTIHYPLLRWYYQRLLRLGNELANYDAISAEYISQTVLSGAPPLVPMQFKDPYIKFYLPNKEFLEQRKQLAVQKQTNPIKTGIDLTDSMKEFIRNIGRIGERVQEALGSKEYVDAINAITTPYTASLKGDRRFCIPKELGQKPEIVSEIPSRLAVTLHYPPGEAVAVNSMTASALSRQFVIIDNGLTERPFDSETVVHALRPYNNANENRHGSALEGESDFENAADISEYLQKANAIGIYRALDKYCSNAGPVKVSERVAFDKEAANGVTKGWLFQDIYIPIAMLPDIAEKEELDKYLATKANVNLADVFASVGDGEYAFKLSFKTEIFSVVQGQMTQDFTLPALVQQNANIFSHDQNSNGYAVLKFCMDFLTDEDPETVSREHISELDAYNKYDGALAIPFVEYDIPDILVTKCNAIYQNSLSQMILKSEDGGAHQYCGGQEITVEIEIETKSENALILLNALPRLSASYVRDFREILSCWPLRIDSEITKFFGVNEVLIETVQIETVDGLPGVSRASLRMTSVDRATRTREALKNIKVENMSNDSVSNQGTANVNNYFDLKRVLGQAELYPDLCLPTIDELSYNGFRYNRYTNGTESYRTYVDPDFYFVYGYNYTSELFRQSILKGIKELRPQFRVSDQYGAGIFLEKGKEENGEPYKMELNNIAKEISNYSEEVSTQITYEDFKREMIFHEDADERKKMLSFETLADLGTIYWNITNEITLPFRESRFVNELTQEEDEYRNKLLEMANNRIAMIDDILSKPINIDQLNDYSSLMGEENFKSIDWETVFKVTPDGEVKLEIPSFDNVFENIYEKSAEEIDEQYGRKDEVEKILDNEGKARKWAEKQIDECIRGYLNEAMVKEIFGVYDENAYGDDDIYNMVMAAADSASGQAFQSNIVTMDIFNSLLNEKNYAAYKKNWKLRPFLDLNIKDAKRIQTYCKVANPLDPNQQFAKSMYEAKEYGIGYGCFQVGKFNKDVIEQLCNPLDLTAISKSNLSGYFLDDYYRNLQLNEPNSKELENYIGHMLYNPGYCAVAFIRNMLVWIRKLIKEEIILSMYEYLRDSAFTKWSDPEPDTIYTQHVNDDDTYTYFMDVLMALLKEGTSYGSIKDGSEYSGDEKDLVLTNTLIELGIPQELHKDIADYKWKKVRDISDITQELKKLSDLDPTTADEDSYDMIKKRTADYFLTVIYKCLGLNVQGTPDTPEPDPTILGYMCSTFILYKTQRDNEKTASLASADIMFTEIKAQKFSSVKGWLATSIILTQSGFGTIYDYLKERQVETLDTLISNIVMPNKSADYANVKKYILALEGRKVLTVNAIGTKACTAEELMYRTIQESVVINKSSNVLAYLKDSYLDMIQNDKRGRMVRAFPCYYMLFVDEGRKIGVWRLHDNFYNMNAITDIQITKSRKIAADTAEIGMTNILKTFTTEEEEEQLVEQGVAGVRYDMRDAFTSIFSPRVYAIQEELKRLQQTQPVKAALKPGIRIHVRLGYSADASTLPIVFNGTIAEVTNGEIVTIVAQGDGIELCNPLMDMQLSDEVEHQGEFLVGKMFATWISKGATPRDILVSLMKSKGSWFQNKIREISDGRFFNNNPYGIVHFGDVDYKEVFVNGEVGQNIFEAAPGATWGGGNVSRLVESYNTGDIPKISINTFGKTFWDMLHICASVQPNYIASVVPFGLRSTVFYGAGNYYYAYDYEKRYINDVPIVMEKRKPFQQQHIYTSYSDIIHNNIKASAKNVKTVAMGVYKENATLGDESKQVGPLYADYDIYPEFQKTMTVDTQYYAKGYPFIGTGFGFATNFSKQVGGGAIKLPGAKEIAWRMTASALRNSMKDMYDGELAVIGDPSIKPYDKMNIYDTYEQMSGTCEVEAVVHSFNSMTGYTTSIYADCIAAVDDRFLQYEHGINLKLGLVATSAQFAAVGAQKTFYHTRRLLDGTFLNWKHLSQADRLLKQNLLTEAAGNLLGILSDTDKQKAGKFINGVDVLRQGWYKGNAVTLNFSAHYGNLTNIVDELTDLKKLDLTKDVFKDTKKLLSGHVTARSKGVNSALAQDASEILAQAKASKAAGTITDIDYKKVEDAVKQLNAASVNLGKASQITLNQGDDIVKGLDKVIDVLRTSSPTPYADEVVKGLETMIRTNGTISSVADYRLIDDAIDIARRLDAADDVADATRLIGQGLLKNVDTIKDAAEAARTVSKLDSLIDVFKIARLGTLPGIIWFIVENVVFEVLVASATEWAYRYLQNLEVLQIYPMKRKGLVMTAGLSGHKGSVVGSTTYGEQGEWTTIVANMFTKKNDKTFLNGLLNFLIPSNVQLMANRLLENKGYPVPEDPDSVEGIKEDLFNTFIEQSTSLYSKRYSNNTKEMAILNKLRIEDITSEDAKKSLEQYRNYLDYPDMSIASNDIENNTRPITSNVRINEFLKSGFFQMLHNDASFGKVQPMTFDGQVLPVPYFTIDGTNAYNLAVLREDAMLVLEDLLFAVRDEIKNTRPQADKNQPKRNEVTLTSATIMNQPNGEWENTGLCFRVVIPYCDIEKIAKGLEDYYNSRGANNFILYTSTVDDSEGDSPEYLFMAKPIK